MKVDLLLCDAAQREEATGKISMLGAGWNTTPALPGQSLASHAVVVFVHVPWNDANRRHKLEFSLIDEDSTDPVQVVDAAGDPKPITAEAEFEVGRPPGVKAGSNLLTTFAFTMTPGLPLMPNKGYAWVCKVNGEESARAEFYAVPPPLTQLVQPNGLT
ncbi:hypothetical protein [Amycolatopsis sp. Hca4]|uniref:DUF6941 family protein n=1 Tax=Amycolatopsis sp. Hca4 TaxID=2742131 RepID=UPI001590138E|nr:hypothetical protein [Amycolatopsis sp. Hca4]QKV74524.1 hypothetical protein HUT10_12660 [Amycolatopsis sp. Hca4]